MAPVDPAVTHLIYLDLKGVRELSQGIHIPSYTPAALIQIENHCVRPLWTTGVAVMLEILHLVDMIFNVQLYHNSPAGICSSLVPFPQDHGSFLENIFDRPRHGCVAPMMMHFSSHDVGCHLTTDGVRAMKSHYHLHELMSKSPLQISYFKPFLIQYNFSV